MNNEEEKFKIAEARYKSIIDRNAMSKITLDKDKFKNWFGVDSKDRECEYCSIKESEIQNLISQGKIYTKRLTTRGRTMEVDRKDPKGHYEINNLIMSCYWCNNAKTDEFSYEEFRKMSCRTNDIWEARLSSKSVIPSLEENDILRCDWDTPNGLVLALPWGINANSQDKSTNNNSDWKIINTLLDHILSDDKIEKLGKDFKIYLLYKDAAKYSSTIGTLIKNYQSNIKIVFLPIPHLDSIWINGCMPLKVNKENKALKAVYSPSFYNNNCFEGCGNNYRKYAYYEHISALEIAEALDLQTRYVSEEGGGYWYEGLVCKDFENMKDVGNYEDGSIIDENRPIILDNNDFVHNGKVGFINQRVLDENCTTCDGKDKFLERFMKYTNLKKICVLKTKIAEENNCKKEINKEYGFLSDKIRFLDEKTLLIKECFYKEIKLEECCKLVEDFCKDEEIEINQVDFDLDYLRVGDLILHNKKNQNTNEFQIVSIDTNENLFSISWVF